MEKKLKIEELLQAQAEAEKFKEKPSELTSYIKQTFGDNIRHYIDENMSYNEVSWEYAEKGKEGTIAYVNETQPNPNLWVRRIFGLKRDEATESKEDEQATNEER